MAAVVAAVTVVSVRLAEPDAPGDRTRLQAGAIGAGEGSGRGATTSSTTTTAPPPPSTTTTTAPPPPPKVLVIGDSLTVQSTGSLVGASAGLDLQIRAEVKTTIGDWLPRVPALLAERPLDVVVVALGTNDNWPTNSGERPAAEQQANLAAFRERVTGMLDALAEVPCVVWVLPAEVAPVSEYLRYAVAHNDVIREELATRDRSSVDWTATLEQGGAFDNEWMHADGIHVRTRGQFAFAATTLQAVRQDCPAP